MTDPTRPAPRTAAAREMTLDEWVDRLPTPHRARRELAALRAAVPVDPPRFDAERALRYEWWCNHGCPPPRGRSEMVTEGLSIAVALLIFCLLVAVGACNYNLGRYQGHMEAHAVAPEGDPR